MNLCIVAVGASSIREAQSALRSWESGPWADRCRLTAHYVGSDLLSETRWPRIFQDIYASDLLLLDTMGVPQAFADALAEGLAGYKGHIVVVNATTVAVRTLTRLGGFSLSMLRRMEKTDGQESAEGLPDAARMMKMTGFMEKIGRALPVGPLRDMRNFLWIGKYWLSGTRAHIESMLHLIGREYFGYKDFPPPAPPTAGDDCTLMDPASGRTFGALQDYHAAFPPDSSKPCLGLLFRARAYPLDTHPVLSCMMGRLAKDFNIVPIALDSTIGRDFKKLSSLLMDGGKPVVDLLVNPEAFRLAQGPMGGDAAQGERFLRDLNVPVLHPFMLTKRTRGQWLADVKGADVGEFLISIFLPELDGNIEMYPVAAVDAQHDGVPELAPIEERIEHLARRAVNWSRLRRMPNRDKRLAVILYNYPAGEATVGSASFLDTFASVAALLEKLAAEGYAVSPISADELKRALVAIGASGSGVVVDERTFRRLTDGMPCIGSIRQAWGPFPGPAMSRGRNIVLPGIISGNVFIGLQLSRAVPGAGGTSYHDKKLPPHHQYAAFYRWIADGFRAHAVVHVGTHGTLEFLPGKEKAVSAGCFPDALIGELPHVYIYYSGNPSEAMIARRRSHAVLIGHLPPPFVKGGLYGELQALQQLLDEHAEARSLNPGRCQLILEDIRKAAEALGWEWNSVEDLHRRLHDMNNALIPARLHTLGQPFSDKESESYLAELFRTRTRGGASFQDLLARQNVPPEQIPRSVGHDKVEARARQWIAEHILQGRPLPKDKGPDSQALRDYLRQGEAVARALAHNGEIDAVLRALQGEYIAPGLSGDMFRSPEILPTGRNLVQFDPRLVPSASALHSGATIAAETIDRYRRQHGRYPRSSAVILWGLETSQTQGETIGQILAYLGVRTAWAAGQWDPRVELVPLAELGRPRIDVTVQICGFFRDMFPPALAIIQKAFELAGFADEPDEMNFVRANARDLFSVLRGQGLPEADAREFALARVFGPAAAEYGTGLERLVKDRSWQEEADLVGAYIESLKHAYTPHHYGRQMEGLLTDNLRRVEVVSQVRASRDYEITDLDHYYEFLGGLARSVEQASGKKAMLLISDTHEGCVRTEDVKDSIQRGVYARLVNPAWLDGMLSHSHHGGQEIAKRLENLIGLAATTGAVARESFDQVNRRLVFDDSMRERIRQNNPYAMLEIVRRLWEANTRGYWQPDEETRDRLKEIYLGLETHVEGLQP